MEVISWFADIASSSCGNQTPTIVTGDRHLDNLSRLGMCHEPHRGELLGAPNIIRLGEHAAARADFVLEMAPQRSRARYAQEPRAFLAHRMRHLRHPRRRRAR